MFKQSLLSLLLILVSSMSLADYGNYRAQYEVTITNITPGQTFTPQLVVTHPRSVSLFELGEPASEGLEILAEGGDTAPLTDTIKDAVFDTKTIAGLLGPGETAKVTISSRYRRAYISVAALLLKNSSEAKLV